MSVLFSFNKSGVMIVPPRMTFATQGAPADIRDAYFNPHSPDDGLISPTLASISDIGVSTLSWIVRGGDGAPDG